MTCGAIWKPEEEMDVRRRNWLIVGTALVTVACLVLGTVAIAWVFFAPALGLRRGPVTWPGGPVGGGLFESYESNGEQIYWTGTSQTGPPIIADMGGGGMMGRRGMQGGMGCATCHGPNGEGGTVGMMMGTFTAPNIQWSELTEAGHGDEHDEHEPYTDETFKRAVTQGVDPAGEPLEWPMPRWDMTDAQLEDLIAYLKTLE